MQIMTSHPMNLKNKKVLVTGSSGFVGTHLMNALESRGATAQAFQGDVMSTDKTDLGNPEIVFHLAALTDLTRAVEDPVRAFEVNTVGTLKLLSACQDVKKFVYVSTLGVYGEPLYLPVDERHPTFPIEPYAASKLAGEAIVRGMCAAYGISFCIVRLFNVYGPGQRDDFVVPRLVSEVLTNDTILVQNSSSTRDFVHIEDVVDGLCAVAERGDNDVYNIGTGTETSIEDIVLLIARLAKRKVSLTMAQNEGGVRVRRSQADVRHTQSSLGWSARIHLEQGIQTVLP